LSPQRIGSLIGLVPQRIGFPEGSFLRGTVSQRIGFPEACSPEGFPQRDAHQ